DAVVMHIAGLLARCRIGYGAACVEPVAVARARRARDVRLHPAVCVGPQGDGRKAFDFQRQRGGRRGRPEAKARRAVGLYMSAELGAGVLGGRAAAAGWRAGRIMGRSAVHVRSRCAFAPSTTTLREATSTVSPCNGWAGCRARALSSSSVHRSAGGGSLKRAGSLPALNNSKV